MRTGDCGATAVTVRAVESLAVPVVKYRIVFDAATPSVFVRF